MSEMTDEPADAEERAVRTLTGDVAGLCAVVRATAAELDLLPSPAYPAVLPFGPVRGGAGGDAGIAAAAAPGGAGPESIGEGRR